MSHLNHVLLQLPEELLSVKGTLRTLDLSVNRLTVLPPSLGEFTNLRTLNLAQNRLSKPHLMSHDKGTCTATAISVIK